MKTLGVCAVLVVLVCTLEASQSRAVDRSGRAFARTVKSFLHGAGLIDESSAALLDVHRRQQGGVCNNSQNCAPSMLFVPTSLIECVLPGGFCSCNECFETGSNGTCVNVECEDWRYDQADLKCVDNRPRQLTAFLLSFFLSSTGAANFYIGRDDLAGGQLFLLILIFAISYVMCYLPCCMGCCMANDDVKGSLVFIGLMLVMTLLLVLDLLAIWAWWLADLIIFAENKRDAGNGCMLQENL